MLKSADIKAIAKQVALEIYALNDEVLSLSDVAIKLSKSEAAIKQMCYRGQIGYLISSGSKTMSDIFLLAKDKRKSVFIKELDVKRIQIVSMDQKGAFIAYCTKMVFLKYYTPSNENQIHFWGQDDRKAYIAALSEILHHTCH